MDFCNFLQVHGAASGDPRQDGGTAQWRQECEGGEISFIKQVISEALISIAYPVFLQKVICQLVIFLTL